MQMLALRQLLFITDILSDWICGQVCNKLSRLHRKWLQLDQ